MNANLYQELAARTECDQSASRARMARVDTTNKPDCLMPVRFNHAVIGLMGEIGELTEALETEVLDIVNIKEELGDCCWYIALACNALGLNMNDIQAQFTYKTTLVECLRAITISCGGLAGLLEKFIYYGKDLDVYRASVLLTNCISHIQQASNIIGTDISSITEANIAKLRVRYPEKYSGELADEPNRNHELERSAIINSIADTASDSIKMIQNGHGWAEPKL